MTESSNNSVILVLWSLKSVSKLMCCQCIVFQKINTFAIGQCLEILRKAKYFTSHQRKLICHFEPSVEMSYTWAGPQTKVSLQRAFASRSISPTSPEYTGSEEKGVKMRNQSTVLTTSSSFTLYTILQIQIKQVLLMLEGLNSSISNTPPGLP